MIIKNVSLETVCGITSRIPQNLYPEVAFAGRSNVGKSSLINALMNRKSLARTSSQPGKTQTINYYNINQELYLVDLPGYGYTHANVKIKAKWGKMTENYLRSSRQLKTVFLLLDIRHAPSANDRLMYDWILENGYLPTLIATKRDKIKPSRLPEHISLIKETLEADDRIRLIPFSALTKDGREEIYAVLDELVAQARTEAVSLTGGTPAKDA
ncbi:MAG: ribosome biogenesis GTP-binding protein YihA/YsxC [Clostridium sp.]|jgi:GTP-binding protein|nr:ribosome biogenesis GTP-binding protein YihA/YsxC [Clostridium sp.]